MHTVQITLGLERARYVDIHVHILADYSYNYNTFQLALYFIIF